MKLSATLKVSKNAKELKKLFEAESSELKNNRASYSLSTLKDDFLIKVEATDATAFRAILNSVSKLLSVYEKTEKAIEDER